jgi:hypothetical protein
MSVCLSYLLISLALPQGSIYAPPSPKINTLVEKEGQPYGRS